MQKKSLTKSKLTQEEVQQRLNMIKAADQLEDIKRDMSSPHAKSRKTSTGAVQLEDLSGAGQSGDEIYKAVVSDYKDLLDAIASYAFAPELRKHYFKNNKIKSFLTILKHAGMTLQVRSMMDIFKDRVKQRNGGNLPTVREKVGLFGKTAERPMKVEEIASKYDVEIDLPPGADRPLTVCGTQVGLMNHLRDIVLEEDDVRDLFKRNSRKSVARFLKAAGLLNLQSNNQDEKCFIACLITPESLQPKSAEDREQMVKLRSLLKKGKKWVDGRIEAIQKSQEKQAQVAQ